MATNKGNKVYMFLALCGVFSWVFIWLLALSWVMIESFY